MKNFLIVTSVLVLGSAAVVMAQNAPASNNPVMGRGRGGTPYAWNDKDKDGICDSTGAPVGQGQGVGAMRCGRRGRGVAAGRGWGRGWGLGRGYNVQQRQAPSAQPQK